MSNKSKKNKAKHHNAIVLSKDAKKQIKNAFRHDNNFKNGRQAAKLVLAQTVYSSKISHKQVSNIVNNALRAATIDSCWLNLLTTTTRELSNALSQRHEKE